MDRIMTANTLLSYADLTTWLKGKGFDKAIGAMNISALSKKPGRVQKRVQKDLPSAFSQLKVTQWEKALKTTYAFARSECLVSEVASESDPVLDNLTCLFQTDLFFRSNDEVTEANAVTASGISLAVMAEMSPEELASAISACRVFQAGMKEGGHIADMSERFAVPFAGGALSVAMVPMEREELGEQKIGLVAVAVAKIDPPEGLEDLAAAMTKGGFPGGEAFAALTKRFALDQA